MAVNPVPRYTTNIQTNPVKGYVAWSWSKSLWIGTMNVGTVAAFFAYTHQAFLIFLISSAATLCLGHSIGMHRKLIHRSFDCPLWLEHVFVYLGSLVGLGGPFTMIYNHDLRDWAQRQPKCHPYLSHGTAMLNDAYWQMHCNLHLDHPPLIQPEDKIKNDRFYRFIQKTSMLQQVPWAILFYALAGVPGVLWGICARVTAGVTGHWFIGHLAHNEGDRDYHIVTSGVQGYNIKRWGLITFGECWHNNHHAFPGSAKLGLQADQFDPGWWVITGLCKIGLVWNANLPQDLPERPELIVLNHANDACLPDKSEKHMARIS